MQRDPMHLEISPLIEVYSVIEIAYAARVSTRAVWRWIQQGWLPISSADRVCIGLGTHPANVWPDYLERAS